MKIVKKFNFIGWSGISETNSKLYIPNTIKDLKKILDYAHKNNFKILPVGAQKSYYDTIYNNNNILINMKNFSKILFYDNKKKIIEVESGMTLIKLISFLTKKKKYFHSIPGSPEISVGGAISNDVHGKDSFKFGSFCNQILELKVLLSNNKILVCSLKKNKELFLAVCGGLGLVGIILSAKIKLKNLDANSLKTTVHVCNNFEEQLKIFNENNSDYIFSWIDCFSKKLGRAIVFSSKFSTKKKQTKDKHYNISFEKIEFYFLKFIFLNNLVKILNSIYFYYVKFFKTKIYYESINDSLYTLKKNNLDLGKIAQPRGFLEFQIVIPKHNQLNICNEIFKICQKLKVNGVLVGGKKVKKSHGYLSFCDDGFTFGITIINNNFFEIKKKFNVIYKYCNRKKIKIYLCKDFFIKRNELQVLYPNFRKFLKVKKKYDNREIFMSDFYLRAML